MKVYIYETIINAEVAIDILTTLLKRHEIPYKALEKNDFDILWEYGFLKRDPIFRDYYILNGLGKKLARKKKIYDCDTKNDVTTYVLIEDVDNVLYGIKVIAAWLKTEVFNDILKRFEQIVKILE